MSRRKFEAAVMRLSKLPPETTGKLFQSWLEANAEAGWDSWDEDERKGMWAVMRDLLLHGLEEGLIEGKKP